MQFLTLSILLLPVFAAQQQPVHWLTPQEHDFGYIPQGVPVEASFYFINTADEVLTIDNVRSACSCTTANDWASTAVSPGDTSFLTIRFDAARPGNFRKKVAVYFSGFPKAEKLYVAGFVE